MIKYSTPEMEIVAVETEDIILASGNQNDNPNGEGGLPDDNF